MNREIKFDIQISNTVDGNKWRDVFTLDELLDCNGCLYSPQIQRIDFKRQYTGSKNRSGKELYEGDIDKSGGVIMWSKKLNLFCLHRYSTYYKEWFESSYPMDSNGIEVIGNIYENPELLAESNTVKSGEGKSDTATAPKEN